MRHDLAIVIIAAAAGLPLASVAQNLPSYEPQQRLRTALDTCLKTEVMQGAYCVQKCDDGFRPDSSGAKSKCVGLSPGAKHEPKKPNYTPPPPNSYKPIAAGA